FVELCGLPASAPVQHQLLCTLNRCHAAGTRRPPSRAGATWRLHDMRLAKLTLCGFKSFADRTEFTFDEAITGVVGPNGCGKSNIVDAIKWVLGERSSKSLRGKEMIDVIFAGSAGRKPSGLASVTLSFENPVVDDSAEMVELQYGDHAPGEEFTGAGESPQSSVL